MLCPENGAIGGRVDFFESVSREKIKILTLNNSFPHGTILVSLCPHDGAIFVSMLIWPAFEFES